jgi:hypothetical protein
MRLLLTAVLFAAIVTRVDAYAGETLDHLKARTDPTTIFGQYLLPDGTIVLHLKRTDHIYSNLRFSGPDHVVSYEQFSKYDNTEFTYDEIDILLHEEDSPDKWRQFEMEHVAPHEKMFINDGTNAIAMAVLIKSGPNDNPKRYLNISPGHGSAPVESIRPRAEHEHPPAEDNQPPGEDNRPPGNTD